MPLSTVVPRPEHLTLRPIGRTVETEQPSLLEACRALAARWRLVLGVALPLAALVGLYAQAQPTTWTASATLAFTPRPDVAVGSDTVALVVPSYVAFLVSPAVLDGVAQQYGTTRDDLEGAVDVAVPPTTATLEITVTGTSADQVAAVANALGRAATARATRDPVVTGSVVSAAVPPAAPSGPARRLMQVAGLVAGLLAGLLVALAVDRAVPRVRGAAGELPGAPLLARVPERPALRHPAAEALDEPDVGVVVRALRDRVLGIAAPAPVLVLAVCSAERGEGSTTVASLLACSLARLDARVVLVDADVVGTGLTREYLFDEPAADLVDVLEQRADLATAAGPTGVAGVALLPLRSGQDVGDLFARRLSVLGAALRAPVTVPVPVNAPGTGSSTPPAAAAGLQVVVLDTPPLLERDEAALLARLADGVVVVAREGRPRGPLVEAQAVLEAAGARTLGLVVNRSASGPRVLGGAR